MKPPLKSSTLELKGDCWVWKKARAGNGYGVLSFYKRMYYAHRAMWRLLHGEIPNGIFVLHSCDNPPCINPDHLSLGTPKDNVNDMVKKGRQNKKGPLHPKFKFSNETVEKIRSDFNLGLRPQDLRATYKISHAQLWRITSGRSRTQESVNE